MGGRTVAILIVFAWSLLPVAPAAAQGVPDLGVEGEDFAAGEVLVRFRNGVGVAARDRARGAVQARLDERLPGQAVERVRVRAGDVEEAVAELSRRPEVLYAEPNVIYRPLRDPDDPFYERSLLWGLNNRGDQADLFDGIVADADIDAAEAWDVETGSRAVVVAVVDTGVALTHPDLDDNLWLNTDEVPGNSVDDDRNGYIDDVEGWDFWARDNEPNDAEGHGTHVAGIVGAESDNGSYTAGVAWDVQIMPLRVLGPRGYGRTPSTAFASDLISAIDYADRNGARILNGSLGGYVYSQAVADAISSRPNMLFVFAAGNDAANNDVDGHTYPSDYDAPNIISVAASDWTDQLAWDFSNYGPVSVDLVAPGDGIASTSVVYNSVWVEDADGPGRRHPWGRNVAVGWENEVLPDGNTVISDSPGRQYTGGGAWTSTFTAEPIDLSGRADQRCQIEFRYWTDLQAGDEAYVWGSSNGTSYDYLLTGRLGPLHPRSSEVEGNEGGWLRARQELQFTEAGGQLWLAFQLRDRADGLQGDGVKIDDIHVVCVGDDYSENDHDAGAGSDVLSGTSQAAPHVAGTAALMLAHEPRASTAQLRTAILESVDRLPQLDGVVATGGRLNANRAVRRITRAFADNNDHISGATVLSGSSATVFDSNLEAGLDPGEPRPISVAGGASLWYLWRAPATATAVIDTLGTQFDSILGVYTGSTSPTTLVASNDDSPGGGLHSRVTFSATNGTNYWIVVDGLNPRMADTGPVSLRVNPAASNDLLRGATPVAVGATVSGSTSSATREVNEPNHAGAAAGQSLWWRWTAPSSGPAVLDTVGSTVDTVLAVYTGREVHDLTLVASNIGYSQQGFPAARSRIVFEAVAGTTYSIAVDGYQQCPPPSCSVDQGTLALRVNPSALYDDVAGARQVSSRSGSWEGVNVGARLEANEPQHAGNPGGASLWFAWTPPVSGRYQVDTSGSRIDTLLAVYTGQLGSLQQVAANDDRSSGDTRNPRTSRLEFAATAGTRYLIALDGAYLGEGRAATGEVQLAWSPLPPETFFLSGGTSGVVNRTTASFGVDSDVEATLECALDGAGFAACPSPDATGRLAFPNLAEGDHTLLVRARDGAGLVDASPAARTWRVDLTPPDTTITSGDGLTREWTTAFGFSAPGALGYECRVDGGPWAPCVSGQGFTVATEGAHTLHVRATDEAGNVETSVASRSWTVDRTPPDTVVLTGPRALSNSRSPQWTFQTGGGIARFECRLGSSSPWAACSTAAGHALSGLAEGIYRLDVRAVDAAGNADATPRGWAWEIDLTPPNTRIDSGPPVTTDATTATLAFSSVDAPNFACQLDGGSWSACASGKRFEGLGVGQHTVAVRATDVAGNVDPTPATWSWTVTAPEPQPTDEPTEEPTGGEPTDEPTGGEPTDEPTGGEPTEEPTGGEPTEEPTGGEPSEGPTGGEPTAEPTEPGPTEEPPPAEPPAFDGDPATTERIAMSAPVSAAVAVSGERFAAADGFAAATARAAHVVLSRDDTFPDSLAGAPLTADGPLLFTPSGGLDPATLAEIDRVLPDGGRVYLLGGTAAIGQAVEDDLRGRGYDVRRLAGASRVETSIAVADEVRARNPGGTTVALARAYGAPDNPSSGWVDSVTGGGWGADAGVPIVVTPTEAVHPAIAAWLAAVAPSETVLFGGTAALGQAVEGAVPAPRRVSGAERTETAARVATELWGAPATGPRSFLVLNGAHPLGWALGLAAGGLAADADSPLLVVTSVVTPATAQLVSTCGPPEVDLVLIGGSDVIAEDVRLELERLDGAAC